VLDLYDAEVDKIIGLTHELNGLAQDRRLNYAAFERQVRDRFAEIGLTVDVSWYRFGFERPDGTVAEEEGAAMPEITITGRADPGFLFDPDKQVYQAVHNVLGLPGEEGWIKTDPDTLRNFRAAQGGHGHGHRH
jgi:hypothetical protein